jgi:2-methylcitrate dehydratase PrpD
MAQPFVDCAISLAETGAQAGEIVRIVCEVAEGTVHRLWEPLASKHKPPTPYAAKFSTPFCMAVGFVDRKAGIAQFDEAHLHDPAVLALCSKISYVVNPADEYPKNFSGHLRAALEDGSERTFRQPHLRGGTHAPLSDAELEAKFMDNAVTGGWSAHTARRFLTLTGDLFSLSSLGALTEFRS